jgi:hypothetical protein
MVLGTSIRAYRPEYVAEFLNLVLGDVVRARGMTGLLVHPVLAARVFIKHYAVQFIPFSR